MNRVIRSVLVFVLVVVAFFVFLFWMSPTFIVAANLDEEEILLGQQNQTDGNIIEAETTGTENTIVSNETDVAVEADPKPEAEEGDGTPSDTMGIEDGDEKAETNETEDNSTIEEPEETQPSNTDDKTEVDVDDESQKPTEPSNKEEPIKPQPTEPAPTEPKVEEPTEPKEEATEPKEEEKVEETTTPTEPATPDEPAKPEETKPAEPKPSYTIQDVDEYMYVNTSTLNVRTGPSTDYSKVTSVGLNTKLHRTGICSNGWSRIDYDGQTLFVYSSYLNKEKIEEPKQETVAEEIVRRGMTCRLTIPSVGVNVGCFWGTNNLQTLVDASDSAALFSYGGMTIIADHRHQGFSAMKNSSIGTKAYMNYGDHTEEYVCIANFKGHNTGHALTDNNDTDISELYPGYLAMYTCNENWQNITITIWQKA